MRFPASELGEFSSTLASHLFENGLGAGFNEQPGHVLAKLRCLLWRRRGVLLHAMHAVDGADARIDNELAVFDTGERAHGDLASAMERPKQRALGNDSRACFRVIKRGQQFLSFTILQPAFHRDGALAHGRHAHFGRKNFGNALAESQAVQPRFRNDDRLVLAAFHFAEARVHVAAQIAQIQVGTKVPQLGLTP